jgi:hypothetical protein
MRNGKKKKKVDNYDVALFATSEIFDVVTVKRQKILTFHCSQRQKSRFIFYLFIFLASLVDI